jgi:hypothetical protein
MHSLPFGVWLEFVTIYVALTFLNKKPKTTTVSFTFAWPCYVHVIHIVRMYGASDSFSHALYSHPVSWLLQQYAEQLS